MSRCGRPDAHNVSGLFEKVLVIVTFCLFALTFDDVYLAINSNNLL